MKSQTLELQYWFKTLLQHGLSELVFYCNLVYKFKRILEGLI